jgi:hypothetical protein
MQIIDVDQGSPEWLAVRLGIPTASNFSKLITSDGKKSTQADGYLNTLVAETLMGQPGESFTTDWMQRGTELEPAARAWYEFQTDADVQQVGFVKLDSGLAGASPDGLTVAGGLELKCPKAETHVSYLRSNKLPASYVQQVQGCMWICERDTWDFASYHPLMPALLITVQRDDKLIASLVAAVEEINERKSEILEHIRRLAA